MNFTIPTAHIQFFSEGAIAAGTGWYHDLHAALAHGVPALFNRDSAGVPLPIPPAVRFVASPTRAEIIAVGEQSAQELAKHKELVIAAVNRLTGKALPSVFFPGASVLSLEGAERRYVAYGMVVAKDAEQYRLWQNANLRSRKLQISKQLGNGIAAQIRVALHGAPPAGHELAIEVDEVGEGSSVVRAIRGAKPFRGHIIDRVCFRARAHLVGPWAAGFMTAQGCGGIRPVREDLT